jgi:hypothetical protein
VFSVVSAALFATQRGVKHISAAVNQHATIKEVFSVGAALRLYNEDLTQLRNKFEGVSEGGSRSD